MAKQHESIENGLAASIEARNPPNIPAVNPAPAPSLDPTVPNLDWTLDQLGQYVQVRAKRTAVDAWETGNALKIAKGLNRGKFGKWLAKWVPYTERTAQRYMGIADLPRSAIEGKSLAEVFAKLHPEDGPKKGKKPSSGGGGSIPSGSSPDAPEDALAVGNAPATEHEYFITAVLSARLVTALTYDELVDAVNTDRVKVRLVLNDKDGEVEITADAAKLTDLDISTGK